MAGAIGNRRRSFCRKLFFRKQFQRSPNRKNGVSIVAGPVDGYLALTEATLGNRSAAGAAADQALDVARSWGMTAYVNWLARLRLRGGW